MRCAYTAAGTVTWARLPGAEGGGDGYYAPFFVLGRGDACRTVPFTMLGALFPDIAFIGISLSIRPATVPIRGILRIVYSGPHSASKAWITSLIPSSGVNVSQTMS